MTRLRSRTWKQAYEDAPGCLSPGDGSRGKRGVAPDAATLAVLARHLDVVTARLHGDGCSLTWIRDLTGVPTTRLRIWLESLGGRAGNGNRWTIPSIERTQRAVRAISRLGGHKPSKYRVRDA